MKPAILMMLLLAAPPVVAQSTDTASSVATTTTAASTTDHSDSGATTRDQLTEMLNAGPRELPTLLALDPDLVKNDQFLAGHPELSRFLASHPEVKLQPSYYLADINGYAHPSHSSNLEPLMAFSAFLIVAYAMAWVIRTVAEQRRWSRIAQTQSEVHNKILDRFGSSGELLEYMKTPAGSKFLESAPIQLDADRAVQNPSLARVIGSIQIGLILGAGAVGALFVSGRFADDTGRALFALGVIGLCVGAGFILSGIVSMVISRRFAAEALEQVR